MTGVIPQFVWSLISEVFETTKGGDAYSAGLVGEDSATVFDRLEGEL